jgi:hypothetical protein
MDQAFGSEYIKIRLLVLPTVELTTLSIPADVSVAPAGSALLFAASAKTPPRRTAVGSVIDKSNIAVFSLELNTSHGDGSQTAEAGEVGGGGELGAGVGAGTGVEFPSSPSGVSSLPMRQPNKVEEQAPTATLRACRRDTEVAIKRLATAERGGIVSS